MLSKNKIKYYSSLKHKKFRDTHGSFLAEGEKISIQLLKEPQTFLRPLSLIANERFLNSISKLPEGLTVYEASDEDLRRISSLDTPNMAIVELELPILQIDLAIIKSKVSLFYEAISDPGNLGTIIRTADWFGIGDIFCSEGSVDPFNPKVIQSSMGSFARVKVHQVDRNVFLNDLKQLAVHLPKIVTVLNGDNIYTTDLPSSAIIFFGNESHGLSEEIIRESDLKLTIPTMVHSGAESLNIGISTGIICSEFRRRTFYSK